MNPRQRRLRRLRRKARKRNHKTELDHLLRRARLQSRLANQARRKAGLPPLNAALPYQASPPLAPPQSLLATMLQGKPVP